MMPPWLLSRLVLDPAAPPLDEPMVVTMLCFFLSMLLLDLFDISLPRGDSIGVSGALCAAALLQFGPLTATAMGLASLSIAFLVRPTHRHLRWSLGGWALRLVCMMVGTATMALIGVDGPVWQRYLVAIAVPAVYLMCELVAAQVGMSVSSQRPLTRLIRGNLVVQGPLLIAEWSAAVLLIITVNGMGSMSLIPVNGMGSMSLIPVVALLLLIRQSYAVLLDIRETYRTTVEVLVEASEGQDPRLVGHADRSAAIARRIATRIGLTVPQVELVSYAALLHDVGAIHGETTQPEHCAAGHSAALFEGVEFFADVLPILRVCDGGVSADDKCSDGDLMSGFIVALASDADAAETPEVEAVHDGSVVARVAPVIPSAIKATVVAAALSLGYKIPAVS